MKKRILVIGDMHTGHILGLNPPSMFVNKTKSPKIYNAQVGFYEWFNKAIDAIGAIDCLIVNGDTIDGHAKKGGGKELATQSMIEQAESAIELLRPIKATTKVFTAGTPYHVAEGADQFESLVSRELGAYPLTDKRFLAIAGTDINIRIRHKIGSSALFHGRHTALARAKMDNIFNSVRNEEPNCRILLFSHVHFQRMSAQLAGKDWWYALTLPCLQLGSGYGDRECNGPGIDVGMIVINIDTSKNDSGQVSFEMINCPIKRTDNKEVISI